MDNYHSYDMSLAIALGVKQATILEHFRWWILKNRSCHKNYHEARYWMYNSITAIRKNYLEYTLSEVRSGVDSLVKQGVLIRKKIRGQVSWYAFVDEKKYLNKPYFPDSKKFGEEEPAPAFQEELPFANSNKSELANSRNELANSNNELANSRKFITVINTVSYKEEEREAKKISPIFFTKNKEEENTGEEEKAKKSQGCAAATLPAQKAGTLGTNGDHSVAAEQNPLADLRRKKVTLFKYEAIKENATSQNPKPFSLLAEYCKHWTKTNKGGTKMLFELKGEWFIHEDRIESFWNHSSEAEKRRYFDEDKYNPKFAELRRRYAV